MEHHFVQPTRQHCATIVWLHGLGDNGLSWTCYLAAVSPCIKWICPTAPLRPVTILGGSRCTAWFDCQDLSEDYFEADLEDSARLVAELLANEPPGIKLGIGGFSMGAAVSLYSATCYARGTFKNDDPYPIKLSVVIALSGWLPCPKGVEIRELSLNPPNTEGTWTISLQGISDSASLPVLLCHDRDDKIVPVEYFKKAAGRLVALGFEDLTLRSYRGKGHIPCLDRDERVVIISWILEKLGIRA